MSKYRSSSNCWYLLLAVWFFHFLGMPLNSEASPVLNFSDIDSGPKTGNTDGASGLSSAQHGAIVTIWGNELGSSQGSSKIYIGGIEATHVYYWKDADGSLPGGPADLKTFHKMQEIAFSIPASAPNGETTIMVKVNGIESSTLPFTVRAGNIRFVKSGGSDTGAGTWNNPWATLPYVASGGGGVLSAGDIVYTVGVGATASASTSALVLMGPLTGTSSNPISLVAYPNTLPELIGAATSANGYTVYNYGTNPSSYWNFCKLKVTTTASAFSPIKGARWIGLEITGPTVYAGYSGAIGGSNSEQAGGGKLYGLYIHHYGTANEVPTIGNVGTQPPATGTWDKFQHLFYLSARTNASDSGGAKIIDGYEIAWGHFTDNPIYQGIHIYDMSESVGWVSPIKIHNNVVKNQRGNAINVDLSYLITTPIEIYNNICISDINDVYNVSALRVSSTNSSQVIKIYNNTFYGYNAANSLSGGRIDYKNNIIYDTKGISYLIGTPYLQSNNAFYSIKIATLSLPTWATTTTKNQNFEILFANAAGGDFSLAKECNAVNAGTNDTILTAPADFFGQPRRKNQVNIGAINNNLSLSAIK